MMNFFNTRPGRKIIYLLSIFSFIFFYPYAITPFLPDQLNFWLFGFLFGVMIIIIFIILIIMFVGIYQWVIHDKPYIWDDNVALLFDSVDDMITNFLNP